MFLAYPFIPRLIMYLLANLSLTAALSVRAFPSEHFLSGIPGWIVHARPNITKAGRMWYVRLSKLAIILVTWGLFGRFEVKCQSIHAVAQAGWFGAVVKHVTQVPTAHVAQDFGTCHAQLTIYFFIDVFRIKGLVETWPARTRFELGL